MTNPFYLFDFFVSDRANLPTTTAPPYNYQISGSTKKSA